MSTVRPGRYRHFRGRDYTVIGIARHSETEEELVVYRKEYDDHGLWVRPLGMFLEMVEVGGKESASIPVPRTILTTASSRSTTMITTASQHRLRQVFIENFSAADIAEPLASFDAGTPAAGVLPIMARHMYKVAGIRKDGTICGYVRQEELGSGTCADFLCPFGDGEVVADSASFPELVIRLKDQPRLFVTVLGQVGGIVTKTDLQKPPVRMWLFGMITIIEMGLTRLIESAYPNGSWRECLPGGRLQKAEALHEERNRRNQDVGLLDCLQFSDRGQIVLRNEQLRKTAGFVSRNRGEQTVKELEALRNSLAHSQDIITSDWNIIVKLVENLDKFFGAAR